MARSRPAQWPPRTSPATDGVADRSRPPSRSSRPKNGASKFPWNRPGIAPHRDTERPGTPRSVSKYSVNVPAVRRNLGDRGRHPGATSSHSCSGESMPPGSRQAIPITAMGMTGASRKPPTSSLAGSRAHAVMLTTVTRAIRNAHNVRKPNRRTPKRRGNWRPGNFCAGWARCTDHGRYDGVAG